MMRLIIIKKMMLGRLVSLSQLGPKSLILQDGIEKSPARVHP